MDMNDETTSTDDMRKMLLVKNTTITLENARHLSRGIVLRVLERHEGYDDNYQYFFLILIGADDFPNMRRDELQHLVDRDFVGKDLNITIILESDALYKEIIEVDSNGEILAAAHKEEATFRSDWASLWAGQGVAANNDKKFVLDVPRSEDKFAMGDSAMCTLVSTLVPLNSVRTKYSPDPRRDGKDQTWI